jgi:hypothetical protein
VGKLAALRSHLLRDRAGWFSAIFFLAIVLTLWTPFNLHSGMPYETGFVYTSEISTWWNGFLFGADPSRMQTSTFFQVGYLLGDLTGFAGSYVPYQIVYGALWWARGFLMFLIVRRLLPGNDLFCYLAGALVLVHSSDGTTEWVGQMPQSAYIFWMLAAFYLLLRALDDENRARARIFLALAIVSEYMSLWTYESQIAIILLAPLLLLVRPGGRVRWRAAAGAWYAVLAIDVVQTAIRYGRSGQATYQASVLRKQWGAGAILADWLFNVAASLKFWTWPGSSLPKAPASDLALLASLAVLIFVGGLVALTFAGGRIPPMRKLSTAIGIGLLLLVLSFPVYMLLDSARSLWRTQILSGLGAAVVFAAVIGLCAAGVQTKALRVGVLATVGGVIVFYGSFSALKKSAFHRWFWERHRHVMAELLAAAPRVRPGTLILLTNVPSENDPFTGDNSWFDMALRLAYPGTPVAGAYWHPDGTPAAGDKPVIDADGSWKLNRGALIRKGGADSILVIAYSETGHTAIAAQLPAFLTPGEDASKLYNPAARIDDGPPSQRVVRRFRLGQPTW